MTIRHRLAAIVCAAGLVISAGCATTVKGAAGPADDTSRNSSTASSTADTTSPQSEPAEPVETSAASSPSAAPSSLPAGGVAGTDGANPGVTDSNLDEATITWADAACTDLMTLAPVLLAFPDLDANGSSDDYAIANIDYYDSLGVAIEGLMADINGRQQPGIHGGDLVHAAYVQHMTALAAAASEGAKEIELLRRSGSAEDLASMITQVQSAVDELATADFSGPLVDDVEISNAMDAAMHYAPACKALG